MIVAASSINSPKLLMLSGIGPAAHLKELGIPVVADRPGVGQNLQDHMEVYIQQESLKPITLNSKLGLFSKAIDRCRMAVLQDRAMARPTISNPPLSSVRNPASIIPDIQYHFLPAAIRYDGKAAVKGHGFQAHVGPMRSKSRGSVTLRSSDPFEKPKILFNYMSHPDDWVDFRHAVRLTREIFGQAALDPYRGREISPGSHVQSDEEIDDFLREHAESAFHPCGTCRMGRRMIRWRWSIPQCRVIGVEGLRVADSSIFPRVTNGNLNGRRS